MADKRLRARLKKLFSNGAIVRKVGKGQVKVYDTDQLQLWPRDGYKQRYNSIYRNKFSGQYRENSIAFNSNRRELFRDYEAMDNDPIIASALDIYADEATVTDEESRILQIQSSQSDIQEILENLFYDILNVDFTLWGWVRNMCKYGDTFLYLEINDEVGVVNVEPLSAYNVIREEGSEENPKLIKFRYEGEPPTYASYKPNNNDDTEFYEFEIAHFRMNSDSNFFPYGKALVENARRVWKQLSLMEDAMLINRIMRAPERRIFKIDVGNIPPNEVDAYMERITGQLKKIPVVDPNTGEYNLRFNIQNLMEDFIIPVRGSDSGTQIDTTPGLEFNPIEDIDYLKNKMFAALKIPRAYLGYDEDTSGKATLAAEDLRFARTIERVQKIIVSELRKIAVVHLFVQGYEDADLLDFQLSLTRSSTMYEQEKIRIWQERVNLADLMLQNKMMPRKWIYQNVYEISEEEIEKFHDDIVEDTEFLHRLQQIEMEGNDPAKSGRTAQGGQFVSPHDQDERTMAFQGEDQIDFDDPKFKQGGRPKDNSTKYRTDKHPMGRDPIGDNSFSMNEYSKLIQGLKTSIAEKNIKIKDRKLLRESSNMLSEDNIVDDITRDVLNENL